MNDPYQMLGITTDADEETIRRRYLALIKEHSPERSPRKFAEIRAAYDELRDPIRRIERQLFEMQTNESLDDVIADVQSRLQAKRIPINILLSLAEV